jgi:hypothetical protein
MLNHDKDDFFDNQLSSNKKSPTKDAFFLFVPLALLLLFHLQADNPRETEKHN